MKKAPTIRLADLLWLAALICITAFFWYQNACLKKDTQKVSEQLKFQISVPTNYSDLDLTITAPNGQINFSGSTEINK